MKKAIILTSIAIILAIFFSIQVINYAQSPSTCMGCHELRYHNSSLYSNHLSSKINCIDCHSGKGIKGYVETRTELINAILLNSTASFIDRNYSANLRHVSAKADCVKCHAKTESQVFNHSGGVNCTLCHNITLQQDISEEGFWKKMGTGGHRNKTCEDCHTTSFQIPSCMQCHTAHIEGANWNNSVCLSCHNSPHIPVRNGVFEEGIPKSNCGACHKGEYDMLEFYNSKHNQPGSCVNCHTSHNGVKKCFDCHAGGHLSHPYAGGNCAGCHGKASCKDCHTEPHAPFLGVAKIASKEQFNDYALTRNNH